MRILLVAATAFEIRPFLEHLVPAGPESDNVTPYRIGPSEVDVLITGIGMVATAFYLGRQLTAHRYDLVVNAGIAGAFNRSLPLGTVVNVVEDNVAELGAEDHGRFLSIFDLGLTDPDASPYLAGKLVNISTAEKVLDHNPHLAQLPKVKSLTSNTIRGEADTIERIRRIAPADIEGMEGAALFFSCICMKVPFLQIRSISNYVEERDKSRWDLKLALKNLNKFLGLILTDTSGAH